jgi:hypothetical protein
VGRVKQNRTGIMRTRTTEEGRDVTQNGQVKVEMNEG